MFLSKTGMVCLKCWRYEALNERYLFIKTIENYLFISRVNVNFISGKVSMLLRSVDFLNSRVRTDDFHCLRID